MKKIKFCDLCGNKNFQFLHNAKDRMFNIKGQYSLWKCAACGLIFINPQPSIKEISKHYPNYYYSFEGKPPSKLKLFFYKIYSSKGNSFLKLFFSPIKPVIATSLKVIPHGKLLDVGCGSGSFLVLAKSLGMSCYGIEPGVFDVKFAKNHNLNIFHGSLEQAKFSSNYFDCITLNHVFEHMNSPMKSLKELFRIIKPGGSVIIGVPQSRSLAYLLFGKYWVQLDVPRHLFTFSVKTLKDYSKRTGFVLSKVRFNSTPFQFLGSLLYLVNIFKKREVYLSDKSFISNKFLFLTFLPLAYLCNILRIGDQVEVILTKPEKNCQ